MKRLYHLKNDYNDHNEITSDINKIVMIYIDELSQCASNNLEANSDSIKTAREWLEKIMTVCGDFNNDSIDITEVIKELNSQHNWCIDTYELCN